MRSLVVFVVLVLLCALPVRSEAQDRDERSFSLTKVVVGAGALAVGTAIAATSSQTTTVTSALGTSQTSTFSKSQLITGVSIASVGGIVLWNGLSRHHDRPQNTTVVGLGVARRASTVFVRHIW
jgi:hypothetical protein